MIADILAVGVSVSWDETTNPLPALALLVVVILLVIKWAS